MNIVERSLSTTREDPFAISLLCALQIVSLFHCSFIQLFYDEEENLFDSQ